MTLPDDRKGGLAHRMRALADSGHPKANELRSKADALELAASAPDKSWSAKSMLGAWARARRLWCECTGEESKTSLRRYRTRKMTERSEGMKKLSDDARCVYTAFFGMGQAGTTSLTFHMEKSRPTKRTQQALDELVANKIVTVKPFNKFGGFVYTLARELEKPEKASLALMKRNSFPITEAI